MKRRGGRTYRQRRQRLAAQETQPGRAQRETKGRPCTDKTWSGLRSWCKARGMPRTKLTLAYFPDTFRGMMATRDIAAGEDVVRVPESLLITASKVRQLVAAGAPSASSCPSGSKPARWALSEHQSLAYWLYAESEKHTRSEWHRYIDSLPRDFASVPLFTLAGDAPSSSGIAMDTREARWVMDHLPRPMQQKAVEQHERLYSDWASTCRFLETLGLAVPAAWRRYVWAWLAVNTRCIHLGRRRPAASEVSESCSASACVSLSSTQAIGSSDSMALAPVLDFLNHSEQADVVTFYDSVRRQFVIRTNRPFSKGQEVFISYGPHDNRFMLLEYGFVLRQNPYQVLELDHAVGAWIDTAKSRSRAARRPNSGLMQPADIDALVDALKQHRLWGDYTISLDDLEPSYRLHAALRLLLFAEQRNMSPKQAVAQWDRWRRGGAANQTAAEQSADRATQQAIGAWVRAVCQGTATLAQRMLSETGAGERLAQLQEEPAVTVTVTVAVDWFLAQCMHVVWLEINAIAARCLKSL